MKNGVRVYQIDDAVTLTGIGVLWDVVHLTNYQLEGGEYLLAILLLVSLALSTVSLTNS